MRWLAIPLTILAVLGAVVAWIYHQGALGVRSEQKVAAAEDKAAVASLTTQGVKQSEQRVKITLATQQDAATLASRYRAEAEAAGDAHAPLDPDRAARLRAGDEQLCKLDPGLCAAGGDAGGGAPLMRPAAGS